MGVMRFEQCTNRTLGRETAAQLFRSLGCYRRTGDLGRCASFVADRIPAFGQVFLECGGPLWGA